MVSFNSNIDFSIPHIQIRALNKIYNTSTGPLYALKEIELDIPQGKILGIIGKSGAGKSSLLRTLNGLEQPSSGTVRIHQQDLTALDHHNLIQLRQRIGMIFQHFNLMSAKTVYENVALPLKISGYNKSKIQDRVNEVLSLVGLNNKADHYPSQLSGGQKQRVGIARALVQSPEILLCDEATSALDPESTATVLELLKKINQTLGLTIVLITHEMQVIREICDQVVVLDHGEIVESGPVWSIFANPQKTVTQELLQLEKFELPFKIDSQKQSNSTHTLIKIQYHSESNYSPDIKEILSVVKGSVHIYYSRIDTIQQHSIATLVCGIPEIFDQRDFKSHFTHIRYSLEVLGYA